MIVGFRLERTDEVCPSPKTLILIKNPTGRTILFHQDLIKCFFSGSYLTFDMIALYPPSFGRGRRAFMAPSEA